SKQFIKGQSSFFNNFLASSAASVPGNSLMSCSKRILPTSVLPASISDLMSFNLEAARRAFCSVVSFSPAPVLGLTFFVSFGVESTFPVYSSTYRMMRYLPALARSHFLAAAAKSFCTLATFSLVQFLKSGGFSLYVQPSFAVRSRRRNNRAGVEGDAI